MQNNFTIEQVREFWDGVANNYDEINKKIGPAHYQRFAESLKYLNLKNRDKILNIWSRTGNAIKYLREKEDLEIYNLEVSPKMMILANEKFPNENFQLTNLEHLNFTDNFFDKILSLETLEHAPDPEKLLQEFYRVLKDNGLLVMSLPPRTAEIPLKIYELFFKNHGEGPHRFLSSKKVKDLLKKSGFEILLHKGTLLFPAGPEIWQNFTEKIIEKLQNTFLKEFGIRQFYVCQKTQTNTNLKTNLHKSEKKVVALSFDLEFWHCGTFLEKYLPENLAEIPDYYSEMTEKILELLSPSGGSPVGRKKNNSQATFFVLGKIIKESPELIKKIIADGHEIAYHGFEHIPLDELSTEKFNLEISEIKQIMLENFQQNFLGFRAPNFSLTKNDLRVWKILQENDFQYDSSLIGEQEKVISGVKEISVTSLKIFSLNLPFGGWYFRILPYWFFSWLLKRKNKQGQMPVIYLHMMDLYPEIPRIKLPYFVKIIKYWGIKKAWRKLEKLLENFSVISIKELL